MHRLAPSPPLLAVALLLLLTPLAPAHAATPPKPLTRAQNEFFERNIRPILVDRCYSCHSAQAEKVKGGLQLDSPSALRRGGDSGVIIVEGDPDRSRLLQAVRYTDPDLRMPPKAPLTGDQIADLEAWIRDGAPDPRSETPPSVTPAAAENHWAFQPAHNPTPPRVRDASWVQSPLDAFILAELETRKLKPAPPAPRSVWLRRVTYDLTGLPPTPEEIEAFERDTSPRAEQTVVDRLLNRSAYGERWARHWLDVARYADSNGLEFNTPYPNAWRYRDYVVAAINADKPYNRFILEQLAGDLVDTVDNDERQQLWTATGFLQLGPKVLGEPNRAKLQLDVVDDQIDATTRAFLGLTVSCARCHDHKFDPIPTRDYYALAGVFESTASLNPPGADGRGNPGALWIERPLGTPEQASVFEKYQRDLQQVQAGITEAKRRKTQFPGDIDASALTGVIVDNRTARLTGVWRPSTYATNFVNQDYVHDGKSDKGRKSIEFIPDLPAAGAYEVRFIFPHSFNRSTNTPVLVRHAQGTNTVRIDQSVPPPNNQPFVSLGQFQFEAGTNGSVLVSNEGTTNFVVADAVQFLPARPARMAMAASDPATMTATSTGAASAAPMDKKSYDDLQRQLLKIRREAPPTPPATMAVREGERVQPRIRLRGDPEKPGDTIQRASLTALSKALPPADLETPSGSGRLELARWIADPRNPLTARVAVNRIWLHLFGRGIVDTPDNFGRLGELPTHPQLLDHLASRFIANGWSNRKLIREIVLSATYRQSALNPASVAADPENRLVARMSRRRLEAEALRDSVLFVSGALDPQTGGPPPGRPRPVMDPLMVSGSNATNDFRRTLYLAVLRNDIPDFLQLFDFVDPHTLSARRNTTASAPQALYFMNSPFIREQSRLWAEALLASPDLTDDRRLSQAFLQALGRPPHPEEASRAKAFLKDYPAALTQQNQPPSTPQLLAWTALCQSLYSSTAFRFIE